jgi:pyruvate/2-oxoglutarate dehydrogenase complex dihydrolipoamide dehydrogenase (E3) component
VIAAELHPPHGAHAWDLLVVGGGTAGIVGARTAAGLGASVLLVERYRTGGDCLWTGCVPSKALLAAAAAAAGARSAERFGVGVGGVDVDFAAVMAHVKRSIAAIEPDDSIRAVAEAGVRVVHDTARFTASTRADVGGTSVSFRQALVATGSAPVMVPIPGLAEVTAVTSDTVWELSTLPERLLVLGGGSIGCELGQAFARLGARVEIVEAAPRLLPHEDADAAEIIAASLRRDGVGLHTGVAVIGVAPAPGDHGSGVARLGDGTQLRFNQILVAVGRRPRSRNLGLDAAGVAVDERGAVRVDARLRTTNHRIWAAGDVTGHPQFTHTAGVHGSLAAANAVLGLRRRAEVTAMPRVTFTQPEVDAVGIGLVDAERHARLTVRTTGHEHVDRAVTDADTDGFTRIVLDPRGRIVGATVVGPRAGEALGELTLAVRRGLRTRDLAATVHPYPTYGYGAWDAAIADARERLGRTAAARAIMALASLRRRWIDVRDRRHRARPPAA